MPNLKKKLQFISEGGSVVRYHLRMGIKPDTDAHHSHGVAMLCSILAGEGPTGHTKASTTLLMAALTHDLGEQAASDVSAQTKRLLRLQESLGAFEQSVLTRYELAYEDRLTDDEELILKLADLFDCLMYACRELALGNRNMLLVWRRSSAHVEELTARHDPDTGLVVRACQMYDAIRGIYDEVTGRHGPSFDVFDGLDASAFKHPTTLAVQTELRLTNDFMESPEYQAAAEAYAARGK